MRQSFNTNHIKLSHHNFSFALIFHTDDQFSYTDEFNMHSLNCGIKKVKCEWNSIANNKKKKTMCIKVLMDGKVDRYGNGGAGDGDGDK